MNRISIRRIKYFEDMRRKGDGVVSGKPPLFTTEDGMEIFVGDKYYYVDDCCEIYGSYIASEDTAKGLYGYKVFSTKEKAEGYAVFNKPMLSLAELNNLIDDWYDWKKVKGFAKNKLKKIYEKK